jgi:hypothetical protein
MAIRYTARLKQLESCRDIFSHLNILIIKKTISYAKERHNCTVNIEVHTNNTKNNDCHRYVKPSIPDHTFYNKLPNLKQTS